MRIAIIVPVFNDSSNLGACLAALRESATRDSEIIVVDDASTDQSAAVAEKAGARVVSLRENGGLDGRGTVPPPPHAVKSSFSWTRTWPWLPGVPAPRRYCPLQPGFLRSSTSPIPAAFAAESRRCFLDGWLTDAQGARRHEGGVVAAVRAAGQLGCLRSLELLELS